MTILLRLTMIGAIVCCAADAAAQPAAVTVLHSFNGADGASPGRLIRVGPQELWGVTQSGGQWGYGSIFRMTRDGAFTSVYSFLGLGDGASPVGLVLGPDGAVYGITAQLTVSTSTTPIWGTMFRIAPSGALTTLFVFRDSAVGEQPGPIMVTRDGAIYGQTRTGGPNGQGSIFQADTNGSLAIVHPFAAAENAGYSMEPIVEATDGMLWGTRGGLGAPIIFRLTRSGGFNEFSVPMQALGNWMHGLVPAPDGSLYGVWHREGFPSHWDNFALVSTDGVISIVGGLLIYLDTWLQAADGSVIGSSGCEILRVLPDFTYSALATAGSSFCTVTLTDGLDGYAYGTATTYSGSPSTVFRVSLQTGPKSVAGDFDGDRRADLAVYRPSDYSYYVGASLSSLGYGIGSGVPVPGDYDGDGLTDAAVFAHGYWSIRTNALFEYRSYAFGGAGDIPVPADFDGDRRADIAVYRPSTGQWFNANPALNATWGIPGDVPVPADYDGDGKADLAIYRPSDFSWWILPSSTHVPAMYYWGIAGDVPVPADYDGDGRTDIAMYRPSTGQWFILKSSSKFTTSVVYQWGNTGDTPVPADYDGDGKADIAVFEPSGYWFILKSGSNFTTYDTLHFGGAGDIPLAPMPHQNVP